MTMRTDAPDWSVQRWWPSSAALIALIGVLGVDAAGAGALELRFGRLPENALVYMYETRAVEFAVCLYGSTDATAVSVERVAFTFISAYSESSVTAEECPGGPDLLGMAHSHPDGDCRFSRGDVAAFLDRRSHPFDFVVCENNQVNWMTREEAKALLPAAPAASPPAHAARLAGSRLREVKRAALSPKPR